MRPLNRVLLAFKIWDEKKKELQPHFKTDGEDRILELLQLQHLHEAKHRLRHTLHPDEQPFMALLNNQVDRLEKKLYPNLLQRLFFKIKDRLLDGPEYLQQIASQRAVNMEQLKVQLRDKQLWELAAKLEDHLNPDCKQVCLPLNCQLNDYKRLNYDLWFEKDVYGNFQWTRLDGTLTEKEKVTKSHKFKLQDWPGLKANQVWNLLEGRALKQTYTDATGHESQRWVELGPNGKQYYNTSHDFDVKTAIAAYPAIRSSKPELIRYLENGQCAPAIWKVDRQYQRVQVQADPANRSLKFFDEEKKPITPEKLNQNAMRLKTIGVPEQRQIKKNGHSLHQ